VEKFLLQVTKVIISSDQAWSAWELHSVDIKDKEPIYLPRSYIAPLTDCEESV
jgi:hypothetical protein